MSTQSISRVQNFIDRNVSSDIEIFMRLFPVLYIEIALELLVFYSVLLDIKG